MASVCAPETAMVQSNQQIPAAIYDDFIEISCLLGDDRDDTKPLDNLADTQHNLESSWHALPTVSTPASAFETQQVESVPFFSLDSQASSWPEEPARVSPSPSSHELMTSTNITNTSTDSDDSGNSSDSKKRNITEGGDIVERTARQKIRRRERNREHAKRSRGKKKDLTKHLEEASMTLKEENQRLRRFVQNRLQLTNESTDRMVAQRIVTPAGRFIAALRKPSNRILTNSTLSYLKSMNSEVEETVDC